LQEVPGFALFIEDKANIELRRENLCFLVSMTVLSGFVSLEVLDGVHRKQPLPYPAVVHAAQFLVLPYSSPCFRWIPFEAACQVS